MIFEPVGATRNGRSKRNKSWRLLQFGRFGKKAFINGRVPSRMIGAGVRQKGNWIFTTFHRTRSVFRWKWVCRVSAASTVACISSVTGLMKPFHLQGNPTLLFRKSSSFRTVEAAFL